jgi:hypothetical protein
MPCLRSRLGGPPGGLLGARNLLGSDATRMAHAGSLRTAGRAYIEDCRRAIIALRRGCQAKNAGFARPGHAPAGRPPS